MNRTIIINYPRSAGKWFSTLCMLTINWRAGVTTEMVSGQVSAYPKDRTMDVIMPHQTWTFNEVHRLFLERDWRKYTGVDFTTS